MTERAPEERREDLVILREEHQLDLDTKKIRHDLRVSVAWDWAYLVVPLVALVASFLGAIGAVKWPGPLEPMDVMMVIVSGWVGTRLRRAPPGLS